jgi:hypothetical protein
MNYDDPLLPSGTTDIFHLAPIPVFMKVFEGDALHDEVYDFGLRHLNEKQKRMGQELPDQYDAERQANYTPREPLRERWTENTEYNPIGSRFHVPPNDFLSIDHPGIKTLRERIQASLYTLLDGVGIEHSKRSRITESWAQYYEPSSGRGHNQHNHCRWSAEEEPMMAFAGGYYLSDGEPVQDHPYSGVLCFHLRGMTHFVRPKKGMLMIWPYDIVHSVKPFYGKKHRCVINFNIQPTRGPIDRVKGALGALAGK